MVFDGEEILNDSRVSELFISQQVSEEKLKHFLLGVDELHIGMVEPAIVTEVWDVEPWEKLSQVFLQFGKVIMVSAAFCVHRGELELKHGIICC